MFSHTKLVSHRHIIHALNVATVFAFVLLLATPAFATGDGLDGFVDKIEELNSWLVGLGGVLAVTGFIWAALGIMLGMAGTAKAITVLICGLAVACAPQLVAFLVG